MLNKFKFQNQKAFTLAEVLITLSIIGVVAAITIPQLVKNMNDYAFGKSKDTFDMKITEAMNQMKTSNEMDGYTDNEKFVDVFQKYMKISKRCDASHLTDCFPAIIHSADGKEVDTVAKLRTGKDFGKATYTAPLTAVQFPNGTSALIAYDPACVAQDAFNNQAVATGCLSILYDINGYSKPNTAGKDLRLFNVDMLGTNCAFTIGATCYGAPFIPTAMTYADCEANKGSLNIPSCCPVGSCGNLDYWAGAVQHCGTTAKLATSAQLDVIANNLFGVGNCGPSGTCGTAILPSVVSSYGFSFGSYNYIYAYDNIYDTSVAIRIVYPTYSQRANTTRNVPGGVNGGTLGVCVMN